MKYIKEHLSQDMETLIQQDRGGIRCSLSVGFASDSDTLSKFKYMGKLISECGNVISINLDMLIWGTLIYPVNGILQANEYIGMESSRKVGKSRLKTDQDSGTKVEIEVLN